MLLDDLSNYEIDEEIVDEDEKAEAEWHAKRSGRFTSSRFGDLMQKGRAKDQVFGQKALAYLRLKYAESMGSYHSFDSSSMRWGRENELLAINAYCDETGREVNSERFQFFIHPELDYVGGTPDGLVDAKGTLEIKCPFNPAEHVLTLLSSKVPSHYQWQVHGHMLVTGRQWCDFVSFDPRIDTEDPRRLVIIRVNRNEDALKELVDRLKLAKKQLDDWMGTNG